MATYALEDRQSWRWWVTPKPLKDKPIHRWFIFPHSFTSELVHALIDEWDLSPQDRILDPFVGAGTTLLAAKEKGVPATGYDLLPLAVLTSRAKIADHHVPRLLSLWGSLQRSLKLTQWNTPLKSYPLLVEKALPGDLIGTLDGIDQAIKSIPMLEPERDFFRLALVSIIPRYSRAQANGGWLKWVKTEKKEGPILGAYAAQIEMMLADLEKSTNANEFLWHAHEADARQLPEMDSTFTAAITSPPYPNRHDYTRIFGVEIMFGFLDWEETRQLRYQSFHSHPEARPLRENAEGYSQPERLTQILDNLKKKGMIRRILSMLEGYFLDMYLSLREVKRVCRGGARIAFVVGNAQYLGEPIPVDELTAEVGEQTELLCEKIIAVRFRGNSAQQMGKYGRIPSRESIVVFRKN
jgi:tRNA G10  N-methylase Trm11